MLDTNTMQKLHAPAKSAYKWSIPACHCYSVRHATKMYRYATAKLKRQFYTTVK